MLLGFSLIHYVRESKREIKKIKKYTSKPREMEKKRQKTGRLIEISSKIDRTQREKQKGQ